MSVVTGQARRTRAVLAALAASFGVLVAGLTAVAAPVVVVTQPGRAGQPAAHLAGATVPTVTAGAASADRVVRTVTRADTVPHRAAPAGDVARSAAVEPRLLPADPGLDAASASGRAPARTRPARAPPAAELHLHPSHPPA